MLTLRNSLSKINRSSVPKFSKIQSRPFAQEAAIISVPLLGALGFWAAERYKVSRPEQYLVRTGLGIRDMTISKTGFQFPFQLFEFIEMSPQNYSFNLQAMSSQKMEFALPGVFTIGPKDDPKSLEKYAKYLMTAVVHINKDGQKEHNIDTLVKGIIEGETRSVASQLTIEEIFRDRAAFRDEIIKNVQTELDKFGLEIYNANIKELQDTPGSEYFSYLRQKTTSEAKNKAKVEVSEANKAGDIGEKEREAETRQKLAQFECETVILENERKQEMAVSKAKLAVVEWESQRKERLARIEAEKAAQIRETELQKEVEQRRISQETERLRAKELSEACVRAETNVKDAEGRAEAIRLTADATLYAKQKEADGVLAIYQAQSEGIQNLLGSFSGDSQGLIKYLMIERGLYKDLAEMNAKAVQGLSPKINVWQTGNSDSVYKTVADVGKLVPMLIDTIHDQTGMDLLASVIKRDK